MRGDSGWTFAVEPGFFSEDSAYSSSVVPKRIGVPHFVWLVIGALVPVAIGALRFGPAFLWQFFVSPFQFFILVPWLTAFYSLKTGVMLLKSGGTLRRDAQPRDFWISVAFCVVMGAACFALNLAISWLVLSRKP